MARPAAADLRHPLPRRRPLGREVDRRSRTRCSSTSPTCSRSRRRARTGRATTPGSRRAGSRSSRGFRRPGCPPVIEDWADFEQFMHTLVAAEAIKTIREVWWDVPPAPELRHGRAPHLRRGCRRCARSRRSARSCSASCTASTRSSTPASLPYIAREWTDPPEQVARRPLRARRQAHRRRRGHPDRRPATRSASSSTSSRRSRPSSGARPSSPTSARSSRPGPSYARQRAVVRRRRHAARRGAHARRRARTDGPGSDGGPRE